MIGLGGSLTSGVPESKYSLDVDGVDDLLNVGDIDFGTSDFSISMWINAVAFDSSWQNLFSKYQDNDNRVDLYIDTSNRLYAVIRGGGNVVGSHQPNIALGSGDVAAGKWIHVVYTIDRSDDSTGEMFYVNGSPHGSASAAGYSTQTLDNTAGIAFGARPGGGGSAFEGQMDEVAIFNTVLDANAVAAIYNSGSPINLTFNQGNYDNSPALQGYWRMGNGSFDDKANGVIHDQDNPGFGVDLFDSGKGTFDSGTGSWVKYHTNTITNVNNQLVITYNGAGGTLGGDESHGAYLYFRDDFDLSRELTPNKVYVIEFDAKYAGGGGNSKIVIANSTAETAVLTTTMKKYRLYSRAVGFTGDESNMYIRPKLMDAGTVITIDNLTIRELNGNPGETSGGVTFSSNTP